MKAVKQIITYLRGRGVLTREQLVELASQGLIDELDDEADAEPSAATAAAEPMADDEYYPSYPARPCESERRGPVHRKGPVLEAADITRLLAECFDSWADELDGLVRLARRFEPCAGWAEAAVVVRNAPPDKLYRALRRGLAEQAPSLRSLWAAVSLERYRAVLNEPGARGPAASAYRAMLAVPVHAQLGKHGWLLKQEEITQVFNLREAQRTLLKGCEAVFRRRPDLIAPQLRADYDAPAYWAFVLLYTARRGTSGQRPLPLPSEHRPPRDAPDEAGWLTAWAQATVMDPPAVTALLLEQNALRERRGAALEKVLMNVPEVCEPWSADTVHTLYYCQQCSEQTIANQLGMTVEAVSGKLASVRQALRRNLENDPELRLAFHAEPTHLRDLFVEDCQRWHGGSVTIPELVARRFGPVAELLCPECWD